ncbi:putative xyloglucan endotransglucosylase/hydrolase protein 32, partial [Cucurbita argyrosperma subsp. argyrosperma]
MAFFFFFLLLLLHPATSSSAAADRPPSPGYWPSTRFHPMEFYRSFRNLWGPQHQGLNQNTLSIWLDRFTGSGFKSLRPFRSGYFGASIKLQPGYTAGVITAFYSATTFPLRPMWLYGSIWDASSWATEDGKYRADYSYQPFVAEFTNFKAGGCSAYSPARCWPVSASPFRSGGLTRQQQNAMKWVQSNHLVYNYCSDNERDHSLTPECWQ